MNKAIKLAYENGCQIYNNLETHQKNWREVIMLPLFWQSLGRALGKDERKVFILAMGATEMVAWWQHIAHWYFDLVLTGEDTEKFWKNLLKSEPLDGD